MPDWSPYQIALACLLVALGLHVLAAFWALRPLRRIQPRARLAWLAFCLGQILLVRLTWGPLELALNSGLYDTRQAVFSLLVASPCWAPPSASCRWWRRRHRPNLPPATRNGQRKRRKTPVGRRAHTGRMPPASVKIQSRR